MSVRAPFDPRLRRLRRERAARTHARVAVLAEALAAEVAARAGEGGQRFARALDLGCGGGALAARLPAEHIVALDAGFAHARAAGGVQAEETRPPFPPASFDLVASAGALHGLNDLPGALAAARALLRPGGLFQAALAGGEVALGLRAALVEAEAPLPGGAAARLHPMLDPAAAPALLGRAGFADAVVDVEVWTLRYAGFADLVADLRAAAETAALAQRPPWRGRGFWAQVAARFAAQAGADGRIAVRLGMIHLRGRAPAAIT